MTIREKFNSLVPDEFGGMQEPTLTECEIIADDYAIEFALFLSKECETNGGKDGWWFYNKTWKTTNELLEIFKKEKGLWQKETTQIQRMNTEEERNEFAIDFAEWCNNNFLQILGKKLWTKNISMKNVYNAKKLLEIFKKEKGL